MRSGPSIRIIVAVAVGIILIGLIIFVSKHPEAVNTNPRVGSVQVDSVTDKQCDGTTLVYTARSGISTIPNSPECS